MADRRGPTGRVMLGGVALGLAVLMSGGLQGCAGAPQVSDYAQEQPRLSLREFFQGRVNAHGIFTDRSGRIVKRFTVVLQGRWDGTQGVLEEDFVYTDGTKQRRVWVLTDKGGGAFEGRADDVVGVAQGRAAGNALNWRYTLALPVDGRVIDVQFDDWMILMDERTMLNKATMSKWGVRLGEVTLVFTRQ
jgi:hypothetical protein